MPGAPPDWVEPMLATLSDERDLGEGWLLERKLDGVRCLAFVRGGEVALRSRNGLVRSFPAVADALAPLGDAIVDGEVVAVDGGGEPLGFQALQRHGAAALWAFDLLWLGREDLRDRPLRDRRAALADAVRPAAALQVSALVAGPSRAAYGRACAAGWEGLIAKRADGRYRGGRSRDWLKLKCVLEQEVVIGGFTEPRRSRVGLGRAPRRLPRGRRPALRRQGGHGLRHRDAAGAPRAPGRARGRRPRPSGSRSSPGPPAPTGSVPELVAQVGFAEWTAAGRLRQPRFLGLREDKPAAEVVRERPS